MGIGKLQDVRPIEAGPLGGTASCGIVAGELSMTYTGCTWADSGSIGMLSLLSLEGEDRRADFGKYRAPFQRSTPSAP